MPAVAETYANNASSTLNGAIDGSQGSLVVNSATRFPLSPQFRIYIDTELLLVTGVSSNTFTVTRGVEGTTAAAHADGATVTQVLSSGGLVGVAGSISLDGTYASLPAAGVVGRTQWPNNAHVVSRDNGTSWNGYGPTFPVTVPPTTGSWTWVNQGAATATNLAASIFLEIPSGAGDNLRGLVRNLPAATGYTITALFVPYWSGETFARVGLGLYDGTKLVTHWWDSAGSTTTLSLTVQEWTNVTSFSAQISTGQDVYDTRAIAWGTDMPTWFRIRDDGSTIYFEVSKDYQKWFLVSSLGNTAFLTATKVGIFADGFNSSKKNGLTLLSWLEG